MDEHFLNSTLINTLMDIFNNFFFWCEMFLLFGLIFWGKLFWMENVGGDEKLKFIFNFICSGT